MSLMIKKPLNTLAQEKITKEEFAKLTHSSRLVNRILKILNEATKAMVQEKIRILGVARAKLNKVSNYVS